MKYNLNLHELTTWKSAFFAEKGFTSADDFWQNWYATQSVHTVPSNEVLQNKLNMELFQIRDTYQANDEKRAIIMWTFQEAEFDDLDDFYGELQQVFDANHSGKAVQDTLIQRLAQLTAIHKQFHEGVYTYHAVSHETPMPLETLQTRLTELLKEHEFPDITNFYAVYQPMEKKYNDLIQAGKGSRAASFKSMLDTYAELKSIIEQFESVSKLSLKTLSDEALPVASAGLSTNSDLSQPMHLEFDVASVVVAAEPVPEITTILQEHALPDAGAAQHSLEKLEMYQLIQHYNRAIDNLPECAEKSLSLLLTCYEYEIKRESLPDLSPLMTQLQITQVFNVLTLQLAHEELLNSIVKQMVEAAEKKINATAPPLQDISEALFNLQKYIRPVDIDLTLSLIEKTNQAAHQIVGQDIVLLLGVTGSGKSTTIHFLSGSKLEQTEVAGMPHIAPTRFGKPELESFVTSPFTRSETRSINSISIDQIAADGTARRQITLCDSPGFGDTDGVEVDIANGIGVARAVRTCRTVKPVILYSQDSMGSRWEGLARLASIMKLFLPKLTDGLPAFTYIFTKFPKTAGKQIHARTLDKKRRLTREENADVGLVAMLEDILAKTKNEADVIIVDPIHDQPDELLNRLMVCKAIESPNECFEDYTSSESLDKLKDQMVKIEGSFKRAFAKGNVALAGYKFYQLAQLNSQLQIHEAKKSYQTVLDFVERSFNSMLQRIDTQLHRISQSGNQQMDFDLKSLHIDIQFMHKMETFRRQYVPQYSNLIELMQQRLSHLLRDLSADILVNADWGLAEQRASTRTMLFVSKTIASSLNKLQFVTNAFAALFQGMEDFTVIFISHYQAACDHWVSIFRQCYERGNQAIEQGNFSLFVFFADQMAAIESEMGTYLTPEVLGLYYQLRTEAETNLAKSTDTICTEIHAYLKAVGDTTPDKAALPSASVLASQMQRLQNGFEAKGIQVHISFETLQQQFNGAQETIVNYLKNICDSLLPRLWEANPSECFITFGQIHSELGSLNFAPVFATHYQQIEKRLKD